MYSSSHYSSVLEPDRRLVHARYMAGEIRARAKAEKKVPVLVFRGLSGTGLAIAISALLHSKRTQHLMMYVRKPKEKAHGEQVEESYHNKVNKCDRMFVIVDDFVATGDTVTAIRNAVIKDQRLPKDTKFFLALEDKEHNPKFAKGRKYFEMV